MTHRFAALVWETRPVLGRWKCLNCGMKVKHRKQAEQLEGLPCV